MALVRTLYVLGINQGGSTCSDRVPNALKEALKADGYVWEEDGPEGVAFTGGPEVISEETFRRICDLATYYFGVEGWVDPVSRGPIFGRCEFIWEELGE